MRVRQDKIRLTPSLKYDAYAREYEKALIKFVNEMLKSFKYHAMAALRKGGVITADSASPVDTLSLSLKKLISSWDTKASKIAETLSKKQLERLERYVSGKYRPFLGKLSRVKSKRIEELMKARYKENVALIKSLPRELLKRYESVMYDAVTGGDEETIVKRLSVIKGITDRQARTIARDQTAKAIEAFNSARAQECGLEYYIWDTAHDERVSTGRGGHRALNGRIYRYDSPEAVIDSYGNTGHPGQRVNCRCVSRGLFLEPGQIVKKGANGYVIKTA